MSVTNDKKTPAATINTSIKKQKLDEKVDRQMEDTFPASDPPSFSGGKHIIGAPQERESDAPTADTHAVREAEKKVLTGDAKVPHTY